MKKLKFIILLSGLLSLSLGLIHAQEQKFHKNSIGIAPLFFNNKIRILYERQFTEQKSLGLDFTLYTKGFRGPRLDLFGRRYFAIGKGEHYISSFYGTFQLGAAIYQTPYILKTVQGVEIDNSGPMTVIKPTPDKEETTYLPGKFTSAVGAGVGIGYKLTLYHFFFDTNIRVQNWAFQEHKNISKNESQIYVAPTNSFLFNIGNRLGGAGSILATTLVIGYSF